MSAMAKMFADMILKEIPPEIREAVTPENLNRIQVRIFETLEYYKSGLAQIAGEQLEQRQILERIEANVCNGNSGKRRGKLLTDGTYQSNTGGGVDPGSDG